MQGSHILQLAMALLVGVVFVSGLTKNKVLVNSKCKCVTVTSHLVPSPDDPAKEILVRNITIIVPLSNRENLSDPTSKVRNTFIYRLSDFCKTSEPKEITLNGYALNVSKQHEIDEKYPSSDTCYTYEKGKCLYRNIHLDYGTEKKLIPAILNPECLKEKSP
nr:immunoglobulin J chain [Protopterus dolloi]